MSTTEAAPVFYLTTAGEYKLLSKPRTCWFIRRLRDVNRDDYMLVKIEPPLIGQSFGLGGNDVHELLISTRHQGFSLFSKCREPMEVYVARVMDPKVLEAHSFTREQVELVAWGTVFYTLSEANIHARELEPELI